MSNIELIKDQIKAEIQVDTEGKGTASIRAVSRLCDINAATLGRQFKGAAQAPSRLTRFLMDQGFDSDALASFSQFGIPDTAVAAILEYYAFEAGRYCTKQAISAYRVSARIGMRVWMQQVVGWKPAIEKRFTPEQIAEICLLPGGRDWKKRFGDSYYAEISRLTGLQQDGHKRPALWGRLTDEWVYQMLPTGVREGVRDARLERDGWNKLHQFLSDDGLTIFERHMETLLILMRAADSVNGVRRSLKNMTRSEYQYRLFDDCRKDGQLTVTRQLRLLESSNEMAG